MTLFAPGRPGDWFRTFMRGRAGALGVLFGALVTIEILFVAMHFVSPRLAPPLNRLEVWFNMGREGSIPTWFSSSQLLVIGSILCLLAAFRREKSRPCPRFFVSAGLLFLFAAMDEAVAIHERITALTVHHAWVPRFRGDRGVWIFAYGLLGVLAVALTHRQIAAFWRRYPTPARTMLAGLAVAAVGAVVLEIGSFYLVGRSPPVVAEIQIAAEEFLEMLGVTVVLLGVVLLCRRMVRLQSID